MNSEPNSETVAPDPPLTPPTRRRSKWRIIVQLLLVLLVFGGGVVTGGALAFRFVRQRMQNFETQSDTMIERIHTRMVWKYDLSDEQSAQLKEILRRNFDDLIALRREFRPRLAAEMESIEEDVAAILTESQRAEWRENFRNFSDVVFPGVYQSE
ncbi:MAG: hypothetical protein CMJ46_07585 [Planctomyces sp.]|nr:hypothetical protein [Planctomyces sp.]